MRTDHRMTARNPLKAPVIGMVCAGFGKTQDADGKDGLPTIAKLSTMRMGVRADEPGVVVSDYSTAGGGEYSGMRERMVIGKKDRVRDEYKVFGMDGKQGKNPEVFYKYFIQDASFLVGLEGDDDIVDSSAEAIRKPKWQTYLGRKKFMSWIPLFGGVVERRLEDALRGEPWLIRTLEELSVAPARRLPDKVRYVIECERGQGYPVRDVPISFDFKSPRSFGTRYVREEFGAVPDSGER